jgi:transposase InsO family protein
MSRALSLAGFQVTLIGRIWVTPEAQFTWHLSDLSISHRHMPPGCPEVNGKVERSHKTDSEEFYRGRNFRHKKDLARKLKRWEAEYN